MRCRGLKMVFQYGSTACRSTKQVDRLVRQVGLSQKRLAHFNLHFLAQDNIVPFRTLVSPLWTEVVLNCLQAGACSERRWRRCCKLSELYRR